MNAQACSCKPACDAFVIKHVMLLVHVIKSLYLPHLPSLCDHLYRWLLLAVEYFWPQALCSLLVNVDVCGFFFWYSFFLILFWSGTGLWDSRLHNAPANTSTCKCRVTMTALLHSWQFISASCQESGVRREYRTRCLIWTQLLQSGPIRYLQSLFPIRAHAPASEPSG